MIFIGLNEKQKQSEIVRYVREHGIKNVIVLSDEHFFMDIPELPKIRQIGAKETIMYRTFYPLLEEIDDTCLIVCNEMMRDRNRSCLTYNCIAKYTNQTPHRMVFEYVPIVEERRDIMILIDFDTSQKYKGQGVGDIDLSEQNILCVRRRFNLTVKAVETPEDAKAKYEAEKERLFEKLGNRDPDTVPRDLHIWTGKYKIPEIVLNPDKNYVARNQRFKMSNVDSYEKAVSGRDYRIIDLPLSRKAFNDFLRRTGQERFEYLSTGFKVDDVYIQAFQAWEKEVEEIYAETGVYAAKRG